jgi:IrrE N-terminal-like domain
MARDLYDSDGLSIPNLVRRALDLRSVFEVADFENVDIISVIEFKLPLLIPDFRLIVLKDSEVDGNAKTTFVPPRIIVRQSIYRAAYNGDKFSRFVLAHELGHIILHSKFKNETVHSTRTNEYSENIKNLNAMESIESQASIFARSFLIHPSFAYKYKDDRIILSNRTGTPLREAASAITISKRSEMYEYRVPCAKAHDGLGKFVTFGGVGSNAGSTLPPTIEAWIPGSASPPRNDENRLR